MARAGNGKGFATELKVVSPNLFRSGPSARWEWDMECQEKEEEDEEEEEEEGER